MPPPVVPCVAAPGNLSGVSLSREVGARGGRRGPVTYRSAPGWPSKRAPSPTPCLLRMLSGQKSSRARPHARGEHHGEWHGAYTACSTLQTSSRSLSSRGTPTCGHLIARWVGGWAVTQVRPLARLARHACRRGVCVKPLATSAPFSPPPLVPGLRPVGHGLRSTSARPKDTLCRHRSFSTARATANGACRERALSGTSGSAACSLPMPT